MNCICCDKRINPLLESEIKKEDSIIFDQKNTNIMWDSGTTGLISSGYGSTHDGSEIILSICDDCLKLKIETGKVALVNDYIIKSDEFSNRKIWIRNKNLEILNSE